jgi:hypothetical protein
MAPVPSGPAKVRGPLRTIEGMSAYLRAVLAADVTVENAPKEIVESANRLLAAIEARAGAQSEWIAAKDRLKFMQESQADAIAESRIRNRPAPPTVPIEELQCDLVAKAIERDVTAKLAAELEREHATVVAEHAAAWIDRLDNELDRLTNEVAERINAIELALDRIDTLRATREVARDTRTRKFHRLKRRRYTSAAREGLKPIRKWLMPPEPPRQTRARNFGPQELMSYAARDFVGREDCS